MTTTKAQLAKKIAQKLQIHPNLPKRIVQELINQIIEELSEGNRIELRNFGIFEVVQRKAKIGRNPKNPSVDIPIPAKQCVKFTPGKNLEKNSKSLYEKSSLIDTAAR